MKDWLDHANFKDLKIKLFFPQFEVLILWNATVKMIYNIDFIFL